MKTFHLLGQGQAGKKASFALGGKAQVLDELAREGFAVPQGFVIAAETKLTENVSDAELSEAVARIGGYPIAVRSSGTMEDLADASFAGQYVTFLEVADLATLRRRIEDCRQSVSSPQVRCVSGKLNSSIPLSPR